MQGYHQKNHRKRGELGEATTEDNVVDEQTEQQTNNENSVGIKKKVKKPCAFYRRGKCRSGENCKYLHIEPKTGEKQSTSSASPESDDNHDNHNEEEEGEGNEVHEDNDNNEQGNDGATKRTKSKKICVFYRRNNCKFGDNCKYSHSQSNNHHKNNNNNHQNTSNDDKHSSVIDSSATEQEANESNEGAVDATGVVQHDQSKYRTKPCRFFRRGHCNSGDDCPFLHVKGHGRTHTHKNKQSNSSSSQQQQTPLEPFFSSSEIADNVPENADNEAGTSHDDPSKYRTKPCRYFRRGKCNSGDNCKFLHTAGPVDRIVKHTSTETATNTANTTTEMKGKEGNSSSNNGSNNNNTATAAATNNLATNEEGEVVDSRIRTKPCRYFRHGHCRAGDSCLFLHVPDDSREILKGNKKSHGKQQHNNNNHHNNQSSSTTNTSNQHTITIYSTNSHKKTKEIIFPYEDTPIPADHIEDLDPFVVLVSWDIRTSEFLNHATIKRGLHDIFIENLGFYETHTTTMYEADVNGLCTLLGIPQTDNENIVLPALRSRLNHLIDAGLKPQNGLFGDYNAAANWLNTMYERGCDNLLTTPKEEAASLVMYIARRSAVFG